MNGERRSVVLSGIPETMLWTLYNRACEAQRPRPLLVDPEAIRIFRSIEYDYARRFGTADRSHAVRSRVFDDVLKPWLARHPEGVVIELGCGLETQFQRCDNGRVRWVCVDVPEAIAVRERFLPESERCRYVRKSVLDLSWMTEVDHFAAAQPEGRTPPAGPVFVTAQGLFMYLREAEVKTVIGAIAGHFRQAELLFDAIPHWYSRKTLRGLQKTLDYRVPPMPWSINRDEIERLRDWGPHVAAVEAVPWNYFSGFGWTLLRAAMRLPGLRNAAPSAVRIQSRRA
ncbi:class I SAM-dependent methyltransferase [Trinickia mobilis]|uniref:class I SAM-dependent methyltransferase n=1 Tax=Trinickia mobilis TaxID=2816356 RepID=UPI001A8D1CEC|nr:class I SAM-dependent methyltransferase [Trinickia mobilis]